MKFLLVALNAKYIHSNPAVYSLKAYAGEIPGGMVEIAEYTINQYTEEILADIYNRKPDVIGISCYIWNWKLVEELLCELPSILPKVPVWLGGPQVSYQADRILREYPYLAGIMVGEGEETFRELFTSYVAGQMAAVHIPGLYLAGGPTAYRSPMDMDRLPFLYQDLSGFANRIIYYESSRGCPFRCSYCLSSIDKKVRFRNLETVKRELAFFLEQKVAQVKFVDRTFNCSHEHALAIWRFLAEHDNGVTNFHFEIAADLINEEELAVLAKTRPGLVQLEIGVQSANPRTLQAIHRVMNLEKLEQVVASIRKQHNIHQHLDLIAGLPYEDYESFGRSFDRVYAMRPQQLQLGFLKVLSGSAMEEQAQEYGICYTKKPPFEVLYTKWLSYEDVLRLKKIEEMVELYYNSNQFMHVLPFLERAFASPFQMYEALAAYYEKKGYFTNSPARVYRYQVLLGFAAEQDEKNRRVYEELLTYDLYLRENAKSRPDFAPDVSPYKEQIRIFYKKEEEERVYLPGYEAYDSRQMAKMTHVEGFCYPVWKETEVLAQAAARSPEETGERMFLLFDYQKRDPLTYEAFTRQIEL